jgi:alkanesulfonate monooxygenase SsuD/methylene tetrahydromethanopterin reductase-like flavin-dependent oxidoreductase (luciferase family)
MNAFAVHEHLLAKLSSFLGYDFGAADIDAPLPEDVGSAEANASSQSRVAVLVGIARREGLTLRQLLLRLASGRGHLLAVGTGAEIAAIMQEWLEAGAADGFNVMCPVMPADLQSFNDLVMPELRRKDLRLEGDEGATLRRRYGLQP